MSIQEWFNGNRVNHPSGGGLFSSLHITLIVVFFLLTILNFYISKKNHKYASIVITTCCIFMPISRIVRSIMEVSFSLKSLIEILPFHLCHLMAFVIPLVYFFKWKKAYHCVMFYGILGGVMTFLFGDYYKYNVLNFYDIESIVLHIMLTLTATSSYAKGDFKFKGDNIHYIIIFLLLLCSWASLGNYLCDENFMYIRDNGLPFILVPGPFIFTYLLIAFVVFFIMYIPSIIRVIKAKKEKEVQQ